MLTILWSCSSLRLLTCVLKPTRRSLRSMIPHGLTQVLCLTVAAAVDVACASISLMPPRLLVRNQTSRSTRMRSRSARKRLTRMLITLRRSSACSRKLVCSSSTAELTMPSMRLPRPHTSSENKEKSIKKTS